MDDVYVIGVGTTPFGRHPDATCRALCGTAVQEALADAGLDGEALGAVAFGSCALHEWGQPNVRGHVLLSDLVEAGVLARHVPITNVESGCATGVSALRTALLEAADSGGAALAVGVDKTLLPDPARIGPLFEGATDRLNPDGTRAFLVAEAASIGAPFAPDPRRSVLMDVAALVARAHAARFGTTPRQLAAVAARHRAHGADNPRAQLRAPITVDEVLADREVVAPLTRAMCTPLSDGAAAVVVCAGAFLRAHPGLRARAVRVLGTGFASGRRRRLSEPSETTVAAARAFAAAGIAPARVRVAEVHDATASAAIVAVEATGLRPEGTAAGWYERGGGGRDDVLAVAPSGGLLSRGHPLAASGLAMVHEIVTQLRGEAGARQVPGADVGLVHNAGGQLGVDEAACGVVLLGA